MSETDFVWVEQMYRKGQALAETDGKAKQFRNIDSLLLVALKHGKYVGNMVALALGYRDRQHELEQAEHERALLLEYERWWNGDPALEAESIERFLAERQQKEQP